MQVFDAFDVIAARTLIALLIAVAIWCAVEVSLKRRKPMARFKRHRWPTEQHRSYFTDCKRVPKE